MGFSLLLFGLILGKLTGTGLGGVLTWCPWLQQASGKAYLELWVGKWGSGYEVQFATAGITFKRVCGQGMGGWRGLHVVPESGRPPGKQAELWGKKGGTGYGGQFFFLNCC